jgi:hypothetical protein
MMRWKFTLPELEEKLGCLAEGAVEPLARGGEMSARGGEMSDREARAQHGTADPIEQKQAAGRFVIELYGQMPPKSGIKFQAVDDGEGSDQPDMFGSQVTVPIQKKAAVHPFRQQLLVAAGNGIGH